MTTIKKVKKQNKCLVVEKPLHTIAGNLKMFAVMVQEYGNSSRKLK